MSALEHRYVDVWSTPTLKRSGDFAVPAADVGSGPALRYSSPWPWVLALAISLSMWAGIGWLVWSIV
jgi:hypothetical protein